MLVIKENTELNYNTHSKHLLLLVDNAELVLPRLPGGAHFSLLPANYEADIRSASEKQQIQVAGQFAQRWKISGFQIVHLVPRGDIWLATVPDGMEIAKVEAVTEEPQELENG